MENVLYYKCVFSKKTQKKQQHILAKIKVFNHADSHILIIFFVCFLYFYILNLKEFVIRYTKLWQYEKM